MYSAPPGYRRNKPAARPKLGPWLGVIDQILEDNESQPKKQRHTAKRIYDRLKEEYSFTGGYTIVKDYVREARLRHKEVFVPLAHPPGDAQADFGEALAVIEGVEQKAHFLCVDLPHSDDAFVVAFPAENTESFCEGHNQAFAYFAGVPQSILYCNESLYSPPPRAIFVTMFPAFVARRNRLAASQARRPPGGVLSDFFGEALERRPWAFKRKSPPEGRSELTSVDAVSLTEKNGSSGKSVGNLRAQRWG
jgi:hypothetical protein